VPLLSVRSCRIHSPLICVELGKLHFQFGFSCGAIVTQKNWCVVLQSSDSWNGGGVTEPMGDRWLRPLSLAPAPYSWAPRSCAARRPTCSMRIVRHCASLDACTVVTDMTTGRPAPYQEQNHRRSPGDTTAGTLVEFLAEATSECLRAVLALAHFDCHYSSPASSR
jgi:hypothetical protein